MRILVTGGLGFIGSSLVRLYIRETDHEVLNIDKLTYAANPASLFETASSSRYQELRADICDAEAMSKAFADFQPDAVVHLAAESHVDRSIDGPDDFIQTNIVGTFRLLQAARDYFETLSDERRETFRFLHVSTDEVFGSLGETGYFTETTAYDPRSPYSASKAGSDHLVQAWHHTFGLPILITNCSNNYGPCQFPEKLIPLMILKGLAGEPMPVYGDGANIRDWLYVDDHARGIQAVLERGQIGETYNIGGHNELTNLEVVNRLCAILNELHPEGAPHEDLITFVTDRPGHDQRYAMDPEKISSTLGWEPEETFATGFEKTVQWYLDNRDWWQAILDGDYQLERLGQASEPAA